MLAARAAVVAVLVLALAGCTAHASQPPAAAPRVTSSGPAIELDGTFRAVPTSGSPEVPASRALEILSLQDQYVASYDQPVLATATWSVSPSPSVTPGRMPAQGALAWVVLFHTQEPAPSCPAHSEGNEPPPPGGVSETNAVVVDAASGAAAVYTGRHPFCSSWLKPWIQPAVRYLSVPWTKASRTSVTVSLPPCASIYGSSIRDNAMAVIAAAPLDHSSCNAPATTRTTSDVLSFDWNHIVPAQVGPACAQWGPGVHLPVVRGCVRTEG